MQHDLRTIAAHADALLNVRDTPDYDAALNGVQVFHRGPVRRIAAAVDTSLRTIKAAVERDANLLLVHHGLFWSGLRRLDGWYYERIRLLIAHDIAVYSAHLPLDVHEIFGNSRLLAEHLGLACEGGFATYKNVQCGVRGTSDIETFALREKLMVFAQSHGGSVITTPFAADQRTRRWAICSGSGASRDTLEEAHALGVDTLIVGEGPHWTAVDAEEYGVVVMYAGHYATETLGVQALARHLGEQFGLPWTFIQAPTGL